MSCRWRRERRLGRISRHHGETRLSPQDELKSAAIEGGLSAVGAGVVRGAVGAFRGTKRLLSNKLVTDNVTEEGRQAFRLLEKQADEANIPPLTIADATESAGIDLAQNVSENSFFGAGIFRQFRFKQQELVQNLAEEIGDDIGKNLDPEDLTRLSLEAIAGNKQVFRAPAKVMYNSIEKAAQGLKGSTKPMKDIVKPIVDRLEETGGIGNTSLGAELLQQISSRPDEIGVGALMDIRKTLIAQQDALLADAATKKSRAIPILGKLRGALDKEIDKTLSAFDPAVAAMKKDADRIWRQGSKLYDNRLIRKLTKQLELDGGGNPDAVANILFKPRNATRIKAFRDALAKKGENPLTTKAWKNVQRAGFEKVLVDAMSDGVIVGSKLKNALGPKGLGDKATVAAFGPDGAQRIQNFAKAVAGTQAKGSTGGKVAIQLTQGGVAVKTGQLILATAIGGGGQFTESPGTALSTAGVILLGPRVLAGILLRPNLTKALITGMNVSAKSPEAKAAIGRLAAFVADEKLGITDSIREDTSIDETEVSTTPSLRAPQLTR